MIATSHVIIGSAVGIATKNPALGFAAGIAAHFVCDAVPHLDSPLNPKLVNGRYDQIVWTAGYYIFAITDSVIAFLITLFLWHKFDNFSIVSPLAWGAFGAYLPDLIDNFPLWRNRVRSLTIFKQFHYFHLALHNLWRFRYPMNRYWLLGILTQVIFVSFALVYLFQNLI